MNRILALAPLLGLSAALLPAAQDPVQDPPEEEVRRDIFGRQHTKKLGQDETSLEGMWQLLAMDLSGYPPEGMSPFGFMLIADGFIAFELHAYYDEEGLDGNPLEDGFQTFMGEYELVAGDRLLCRTLVGSYIDEEADVLDYEPPGIMREFTLERDGKLLTLRWGDDDWITYGRRPHSGTSLEDIFGNKRGRRSLGGPDIFGRERTGEEEEAEGDGGR
jgi:hypothetical protein